MHTPTPILFRFNILLLKFAQIDEAIQRLCTPPEIVMSTINGTGTARTCFEIVNGNGLNHVSTKLTLDCISENCHKITHAAQKHPRCCLRKRSQAFVLIPETGPLRPYLSQSAVGDRQQHKLRISHPSGSRYDFLNLRRRTLADNQRLQPRRSAGLYIQGN